MIAVHEKNPKLSVDFCFDSADDLFLIGESLLEIDEKKRKVDPKKFKDYVQSNIVDGNMYYLFEGRGDEIHVMPLSFSEFYSVYDGSKEETFDDYMVYGGLPAVAMMKREQQKSGYLITQLQNVYLKSS